MINLDELDAEFESNLRQDRELAAPAPPAPVAACQEPQTLWINCEACGPQTFHFKGSIHCPTCKTEWPFKVNLKQPIAPPPAARQAPPPGLLL